MSKKILWASASKGNHQTKLLAMFERMKLPKGCLYDVQVQHDSWCNLMRHKGNCNCDRDIVSFRQGGVNLSWSAGIE